jgi:hypothetical protein
MRKTLIAASVLALVAGSASAATVSYSDTTGTVGGLGTLSLQQFDTLGGTRVLTGIKIEWSAAQAGTFKVVEDSASGTVSAAANFISGSIQTFVSPAGAAGPSLNQLFGTAVSAVAVSPTYNQAFDGTSTDTQNFGPVASFVGGGTVGYTLFGSALATATISNGLLSGIGDYLMNVDAEITYTYDEISAVPVPAALPLLATAFGVLGLMRLRRKA